MCFWKTQKRNFEIGQVLYELKHEEVWSVFLLKAASSDETCKALTYNNFLISCCI